MRYASNVYVIWLLLVSDNTSVISHIWRPKPSSTEPFKWLTANIYRPFKTLEEEFKVLQLGRSDVKSIKRASVWKCLLSWWQMGGVIRTDCFIQITSDTCLRPTDYSVRSLLFPVISSTACTVHEVLNNARQMITPDQIRCDFKLSWQWKSDLRSSRTLRSVHW